MRRELIEKIRGDFEMSMCGRCPYGIRDDCQHYYGDGCVFNEDGEYEGD